MNEFSQLRDEDESFAAVIRPLIMYCMCVMICGENEPPGNIDFISLEISYGPNRCILAQASRLLYRV